MSVRRELSGNILGAAGWVRGRVAFGGHVEQIDIDHIGLEPAGVGQTDAARHAPDLFRSPGRPGIQETLFRGYAVAIGPQKLGPGTTGRARRL